MYKHISKSYNELHKEEQLKKLDDSIQIRKKNHEVFKNLISQNPKVKIQEVNIDQTSSFCLALLLPTTQQRDDLLSGLKKHKIESRTIVAGNLLRQPVFTEKLKGKYRADSHIKSDEIHDLGLYMPNHQFIDEEKVKYMVDKVNSLLK